MLKKSLAWLLFAVLLCGVFSLCASALPEERAFGYPLSVSGVSNMVKIENGNSAQGDSAVFTEETLLPYVAYVDQNGEVAGSMFDGVIFAPTDNRIVPQDQGEEAVMSDWLAYIQSTFAIGRDLDSLNNVVGTVYSTVSPGERLKVYLTVPYPNVINKPFGDLNGDGIDEFCRTLEERTAIVTWYADKYISAFNARNFSNIELAGFCWGGSEVDFSASADESVLASAFNKYVRDRGFDTVLQFSCFGAGFDKWEELGFSAAFMQSGALPQNADGTFGPFDTSRISEFSSNAALYGLGVAVETEPSASFDGSEYLAAGYNYESFLFYGAKHGYINSLKVFDQDSDLFYDFCHADISTPKGIYLRRLYDLTYSFLCRTYTNKAPELSVDTDFEIVYGDEHITINLGVNDSDSHWENIKIEFPNPPAHGRVAAAASKKALIYNVDPDFTGEDSFTVRVTDGFNYSNETEITVSVYLPETSEPSDLSEPSDPSVPVPDIELPSNENNSVPIWVIVLLSLLAFLMVAVAVAMVVKSRKK